MHPAPALPDVVVIETPNLGDRSYVVHLDGLAVVVDPQRDLDRVEAVLAEHGLTVTHVVETHIHNDYVSGGLVLARENRRRVRRSRGLRPRRRHPTGDGGPFIATGWPGARTPGHTPAPLVRRRGRLRRGGLHRRLLLFGGVGRPGLIGPDHTHDCARSVAQRPSAHRVEPDAASSRPTAAARSPAPVRDRGSVDHRPAGRGQPVHRRRGRVRRRAIAGLDAYPAYYAHMGPANQAGPGPIDLSLPERADAAELRRRIDAGEWVVDLRSRRIFAEGHLRGTLSFDGDGNAVTYLGWVIPWGTPLTLLGDTPERVTAMQRELVRIGIDRPAAFNDGAPVDWALDPSDIASYRRADFRELDAALADNPDLIVVDSRRRTEWQDGHVTGARHVPLHELVARADEIATWARAAAHAGRDATSGSLRLRFCPAPPRSRAPVHGRPRRRRRGHRQVIRAWTPPRRSKRRSAAPTRGGRGRSTCRRRRGPCASWVRRALLRARARVGRRRPRAHCRSAPDDGYAPAAAAVLVICRSGNRSKSATAHLIALGVDAWNVAGGMAAWQASGGPVVDLEGAPGRVA
jgi:rhodanese-related sulfurtransferase